MVGRERDKFIVPRYQEGISGDDKCPSENMLNPTNLL
jgi:hypothetical protein